MGIRGLPACPEGSSSGRSRGHRPAFAALALSSRATSAAWGVICSPDPRAGQASPLRTGQCRMSPVPGAGLACSVPRFLCNLGQEQDLPHRIPEGRTRQPEQSTRGLQLGSAARVPGLREPGVGSEVWGLRPGSLGLGSQVRCGVLAVTEPCGLGPRSGSSSSTARESGVQGEGVSRAGLLRCVSWAPLEDTVFGRGPSEDLALPG